MDTEPRWDGIVTSTHFDTSTVGARHEFADHAKHGHWDAVTDMLKQHPELINSTRLDSVSRYTPLHQAAYLDAPVEVVQALLNCGAWRTPLNHRGERPR